MVPAGPSTGPTRGSWAWWRTATLQDAMRATGSRIPPRILLGTSYWTLILVPSSGTGSAAEVAILFVLATASWFVVIRKVGWPSLIVPWTRRPPFFLYWAWVFFAPPPRRSSLSEWAAWVLVASTFAFALFA